MSYFLSHPHSRAADEESITAEELIRRYRAGQIDANALVYPADGSAPVDAATIAAPKPPPLPESPTPAPRQYAQPKKASKAWLWVLLVVFASFVMLIAGSIFLAKVMVDKAEDLALSSTPMMEDRKDHEFKWIKPENYWPDGPADEPDKKIFDLVRYPSGENEMAAYLTPDPKDGKKHPVMIWSKGGFGGIGDFLWKKPSRTNDQTARAFREAGIVLMCPSYRGENDNPGEFELFYGEVDDFLAAVEYAKSLPYVDPERVYIGGHSTGGTIALLAAASGIECRGIFSFGGAPDMMTVMEDGEGYENTPYDINSTKDHQLRSAIRYTDFITSPTFYIEGDTESFYADDAKKMARIAKRKGVPFSTFLIEKGSHYDVLNPLTNLIARKILADDGDAYITLTQTELDDAWNKVNNINLITELTPWFEKGGELKPIFDNLEDDAEPTSYEQIAIVKKAVQKVLKDNDPESTNIAELVETGDYIDTTTYNDAFIEEVNPLLRDYITNQLKNDDLRTDITESNCLRIMGSFALAEDKNCAPLAVQLAKQEYAPHNGNWEYVFEEIDDSSETGIAILDAFRDDPPVGEVAGELMNHINHLIIDQKEDDEMEEEDKLPYHPYDSEKGAAALEKMIGENGDETFHATMSIAFVDEQYRETLLEKALQNESTAIQMEAAWAGGWNGDKAGVEMLQKFCLDLDQSQTAKNYLEELGFSDAIPEAAKEPDFAATAKMIKWLQHPNELGESPESIKIIDSRKMYWPPNEEEIPVWLFKFTYQFDEAKSIKTSYGMVGGSAWSSFTAYPKNLNLGKLYGHHCALEMNWIDEDELEEDLTDKEGLKLLLKKNPGIKFGKIPETPEA